MKKYVLRDSATRWYLEKVSDDGLKATFSSSVKDAYAFTVEQRNEFRTTHRYIAGRFVLLSTALARIAPNSI
ncbi:MAG: hypothetical protein Q7S87_03505 [Agitococcus sp.]|nr:hypothetical protein [Agitococcus sp.]MDO9177653.1 hypothetical protein [Agitococcus sp.]